jgi:wobble nucleotide-excising tRNase
MRTLTQEALRLTDKLIINLRLASEIATGKEKGSVFKLAKTVAIAHSWCSDLQDMTRYMKLTDKAEILEHELFVKNAKASIDDLFDDLSEVIKCLNGELPGSLHQIQVTIIHCETMANLLKDSISSK